MKRILTVLLTLSFFIISISAEEGREYSWYCKHVADHKQPTADAALSFIEKHDAYYIDHTHAEADADDKVIYLTFDAGYENGNVKKILDVLKEENVPAAFFVLGYLVRHDTDLVRRMNEEGHLVCNHTVNHKNMSKSSDETLLQELRALEEICREYGIVCSPYYRPPEGRFSRENLICASENGYKTIFWSFAYADWSNEKQPDQTRAKQIIMDNAHNGEVMLLHPTSSTNAAILGDVIRALKSDGYRFGTLDELTEKGNAA